MIWTSPYAPLPAEVPEPLARILALARRAPERTALVDAASGAGVSFGMLAARIDRLAAALAGLGVAPGDAVALCAPNVPPWAGVALGAMRAGGAAAGLAPDVTEEELARGLAAARARVLVCAPEVADRAAGAAVEEIVVLARTPADRRPPPMRSILSLLAAQGRAPALPPDRGRPALLPSSSGTTGLPKAVMLTRANLAAGVAQVQAGLRFGPKDTVLAVAPFAHVMGFVAGLVAPLAAGATVVTLPRFAPSALVEALVAHRVTVLIAPPPVAAALAEQPAPVDLPALELVVVGGAPLDPELQARLQARLPRAVVAQGYGMTETTLPIPIPDRERGTPPGAGGWLAPSTELRVVDPESGRDLGADEPGELWVRGPQVMKGYLENEEATRNTIDSDGWLHTGDVAELDEDGHYSIVDRVKELIKYKGFQVPPAELEALLLTHPKIADTAVIGIPDEEAGELPKAFVVKAPGQDLTEDEVKAFVSDKVASYKQIRLVEFIDEIPKSASGKILRRHLRDG